MNISALEILRELYSRETRVTIVEVGPADIMGNATALLSDGSTAFTPYPVVGRVFETITHEPEIEPHRDFNGWRVRPHGESEWTTIRASDLARTIIR